MKKYLLLLPLLFPAFTGIFAQQPDEVKGEWLNDARDARVEIYKSGDKYFGKITWTKELYEADGQAMKKDTRNKNEQLRNRTILNLVMLSGFTFTGTGWTGGEIYDPKSGKTYTATMKLKGKNLEIRGYVGSPVFGKTTVWTRS